MPDDLYKSDVLGPVYMRSRTLFVCPDLDGLHESEQASYQLVEGVCGAFYHFNDRALSGTYAASIVMSVRRVFGLDESMAVCLCINSGFWEDNRLNRRRNLLPVDSIEQPIRERLSFSGKRIVEREGQLLHLQIVSGPLDAMLSAHLSVSNLDRNGVFAFFAEPGKMEDDVDYLQGAHDRTSRKYDASQVEVCALLASEGRVAFMFRHDPHDRCAHIESVGPADRFDIERQFE